MQFIGRVCCVGVFLTNNDNNDIEILCVFLMSACKRLINDDDVFFNRFSTKFIQFFILQWKKFITNRSKFFFHVFRIKNK
jgi:hypothetical protein